MSPTTSYVIAVLQIAFGLVSALKSFSFLFKLRSNNFNGTGKDFDIYYLPLFLLGGCGSLYAFFLTGMRTLLGLETAEVCSNSAMLFTHFLAGTSFLQIALNWMEVAGLFKPYLQITKTGLNLFKLEYSHKWVKFQYEDSYTCPPNDQRLKNFALLKYIVETFSSKIFPDVLG